jgi:hypothetical protein
MVRAKRKRIDRKYCKGVRVVQPVKRSVTVVEVEKVLDIMGAIDDDEWEFDDIEAVNEGISIPSAAMEDIVGDGFDTLIGFRQ